MLGFALGLVASNAAEWAIHKYALHGQGRKKGTFWAFHFHEHHRNVRQSGGHDPAYERPFWSAPSTSKEVLSLIGTALASTPLLPISPGFVAASWLHASAYYFMHKKAHLDPEWARKWVPWHVDHHLGPNQHKNWCVTYPFMDWVMGTREHWVGTPAERAFRERMAPKVATDVAVAAV